VGNDTHTVEAKNAFVAMEWVNRNVIDQLDMHPMAWMDTAKPNTFIAQSGNFFD
jgi:hypothetical protein